MYIYIITNKLNGKQYVGQQSHRKCRPDEWVAKAGGRVYDHFRKHTKNNKALHRAINKYGKDNFTYEILDYQGASMDALNAIEKWKIAQLGTLSPNGYNLKSGGSYGGSPNEETRRKISESLKGYKHSDEAKENMRKSQLGRKHTPESKVKMSQAQMGNKKAKGKGKNQIQPNKNQLELF